MEEAATRGSSARTPSPGLPRTVVRELPVFGNIAEPPPRTVFVMENNQTKGPFGELLGIHGGRPGEWAFSQTPHLLEGNYMSFQTQKICLPLFIGIN